MGIQAKQASRVHVLELGTLNRLVCGRKYHGRLRLVELDGAEAEPDLCGKCRLRLHVEIRHRWLVAQPRPAGYQYTFGFSWE